ncbi:MAG: hypothetical protein V4735_03215 [Pseudomonadota bacterium]
MDSKTATAAHQATELATTAQAEAIFASENIIYLMGLSFILGSLFTIFVLIVLDFMRRNKQ